MDIVIITDRQPWLNGEPQAEGAEVFDVDDTEAAKLIREGFALELVVETPAESKGKGKGKA